MTFPFTVASSCHQWLHRVTCGLILSESGKLAFTGILPSGGVVGVLPFIGFGG